ncbi:MAG TPA: DUF3800 domain-containing protein [Terracidiphilus sp.]|nr:DUF3800 domain-containing protein [Terracidiphilus sp.]
MASGASNSAFIYLDEAGDLGWKFSAPYRQGGSSRYLTISAICTPETKSHLPGRAVRRIYRNFRWTPSVEHKWNSLDANQRSFCAAELRKLCDANPDIVLHAIVVKKQNVLAHIQSDSNKLYNYMVRLALVERMAKHDVVTMIPDPRSIKVRSGNSLHDYLQTVLWFEEKASTNLLTCPQDSAMCKGIQMADFLAGTAQAYFEDNASRDFAAIQAKLILNRLFF